MYLNDNDGKKTITYNLSNDIFNLQKKNKNINFSFAIELSIISALLAIYFNFKQHKKRFTS